MDIISFRNKLIKSVQDRLGNGFAVSESDVRKCNDVLLHGISIKDNQSPVAPCIYIDEFYKEYENSTDIGIITEKVLDMYKCTRYEGKYDISKISSFRKIKKQIMPRLVNVAMNRAFLRDKPYKIFNDLAVCYCINLDDSASITVSSTLFDSWKISIDDLNDAAIKNISNKDSLLVETIGSALTSIVGSSDPEISTLDIDDIYNNTDMYVISLCNRKYGAAAILADKLLSDLANKMDSDLFLIPSSIHEYIAIRDDGKISVDNIRDMVLEVNNSTVMPEDILSYSVYRYDRNTDTVTVA